ncbi:MAG TPA: cysteine dioxygenase family protein [Jatrophihabitans sp.]|nr:cysteine dioxygenase family protein [Jatrophihabitans sp.]
MPASHSASPASHPASRSTLFLNPVQLIDYTRFVAAEVLAGGYPYVRYDESRRWHQRLYRDRRVDLWLISWLPSQGTQLHDHGGSAGAFTVLAGELSEAVHASRANSAGGSLLERTRRAGESIGFGRHYVHDVRNLGDRPAVSVHAYSAPLTSMTYYDLDPAGRLTALLTLATEDPEPALTLPGRGEPALTRPGRGEPAA